MKKALIVTDVQNDFCEGGSLAVVGGQHVAGRISEYLADHAGDYDAIVATRDHHVDPGSHFSADPDFVDTWPRHCVTGTPGADFHPDLDTSSIDDIFDKGSHAAAYSGFEGADAEGRTLETYLRDRAIDTVDVVGIATDHCVRATALDAGAAGFHTRVLIDLTAGVAEDTTKAAVEELAAAGVEVVASQ